MNRLERTQDIMRRLLNESASYEDGYARYNGGPTIPLPNTEDAERLAPEYSEKGDAEANRQLREIVGGLQTFRGGHGLLGEPLPTHITSNYNEVISCGYEMEDNSVRISLLGPVIQVPDSGDEFAPAIQPKVKYSASLSDKTCEMAITLQHKYRGTPEIKNTVENAVFRKSGLMHDLPHIVKEADRFLSDTLAKITAQMGAPSQTPQV